MSDPLFLIEKLDQLLLQSPLLPACVPPRDHALPDLVGSQVKQKERKKGLFLNSSDT